MNINFITGHYFSNFTNRVFHIIFMILTALRLFFALLNRVVLKIFAVKIDTYLSNRAKKNIAKRTAVEHDTILLSALQSEYTCNIKYIADEIIKRDLPYNIIWTQGKSPRGPFPDKFEFVKVGSQDYYSAIARSKVVVQNGHALQRLGVHKNKDQYWMQTWHGSLGLKRLEGAGGDEKFYNKMRKLDSEQTDYLISNSKFEDDVFRNTYWPDVPILRLGHARNDILFDKSEKTAQYLRKKVMKRLNINDTGQKFLLFAPTHDDKNLNQAFGNIDFDKLTACLSKKFGGSWAILVRTHNSNKKRSSNWFAGLPLYCHNASFYPDIQELMVVADAGITDYSSWICDFILTEKPSFLYGANIKEYNRTRGFYHKIEDTPFSMATNNHELIKNISVFDKQDYKQRVDKFLDDCVCIDDGKASKRIVDKIEELMNS